MITRVEVKGIKAVVNRWKLTDKKVFRRAARGLREGAKFLYKKSQGFVPVESGHLKRSGYYKSVGKRSGKGAIYAVGYTADYAVYVHEDLTAAHGREFNLRYASLIAKASKSSSAEVRQRYKLRRPQERAKFLSYPARLYRRRIRKIIAKNAKV